MKRAFLLAALATAAMQSPAKAQTYDDCIALASRNPDAALTQAERMLAATGDPAWDHCAAMALGARGAWRRGAERLADLAARPAAPAMARAEMLEQAAGFWMEAGDAGLARAALDRALTLAPGHPAVLAARADLSAAEGRHDAALADVTAALAALPQNAALLTMRAAARRLTGDPQGALADADAALAVAPGLAAALFERGAAAAAAGEPARARADWLAAIQADPDSDAAERARASLAGLDGG
jgi:regulator of sirC expression with transglutaminase-like and TPR domain